MPDFVLLAKVMLLGALAAATAMLLSGAYAPPVWWRRTGWAWSITAGIYAGCGFVGEWPHWPPLEDRARILTVLLPLMLLIETIAAATSSTRAVWLLRLTMTAAAGPIVLYNSVYLVDLSGPGSAHWLPVQAVLVLCVLAVLLFLVWWLLDSLQTRTSARTVQSLLALDAFAAALTVMLSGYYRGGAFGLALAAAIGGATLAACFFKPLAATSSGLGVSVIGINTVLLIGRFFGSLPTGLAVCLMLAPLLAWFVELPRLRMLPNSWRTAARLICVAAPLIAIVLIAQDRFAEASAARTRAR